MMGSLFSRLTAVPAAITVAAALALLLSAVAPAPQRATAQDSVTIDIVDFAFSGGSITVEAGTTVTWVNQGAANHTATASDGSFDTGTIAPGGSGSVTFNTPGTYSYFCAIHPDMTGTITVVAASGDGTDDGATDDDTTDDGTTQMPTTGVGDPAGGSSTTLLALTALGALVLTARTVMMRHRSI
jgi:plastocyanin